MVVSNLGIVGATAMTRLFPSALVLSALILVFGSRGVDWVYEATMGEDGPTVSSELVYVLYYVGVGWFVCWVALQPCGPRGEGFTSRIHHRLSLLIFPLLWLGQIVHGIIVGLFDLPYPHATCFPQFLYGAFFIWWIIPVEWWAICHRAFMRDRPKRTQTTGEPAIVRVVRVALVASGLGRDDALRPALASPSRVVEPSRERSQEFESDAFTELAGCLLGMLGAYLTNGCRSGVW